MQQFASEISQLRAMGFAEALPFARSNSMRSAVARLESGRYGLAVEFFVSVEMRYSVVTLEVGGQGGTGIACDAWSEVLRGVRCRAVPSDDD